MTYWSLELIGEQVSPSLNLVMLGNPCTDLFYFIVPCPSLHLFAYTHLLYRQTEIYILLFFLDFSGSNSNRTNSPDAIEEMQRWTIYPNEFKIAI